MNEIVIFFRFLLANKFKIIFTLLLTVFFIILLFPLSDLNDSISSQISKITSNNVFVQFDDMHLNPLTASVSFDKIYIETPQTSAFTSDELSLSPSIASLLSKKAGGTLHASGFLKGDLQISIHPASTTNGVEKSKIEISANNINLKEAREVANIRLPIKGQLNLSTQSVADLTLSEQPELDLNLSIIKFEMASTFVSLNDFGQIALPEIKLAKVELKGHLANGKFLIENGKLGTTQDELFGDVKGELGISFQNTNGQLTPVIGSYNISLDIKAQQSFKDKAKLFLSFLDGYKVDTGTTSHYKLRISAAALGMSPQFAPLN